MRVGGTVRVPGDKSITHRALLFAALARGTSRIAGALTSLDARSTARVLRRLGAEISPLREGSAVTVTGRGRFRPPAGVLDCGNSGTTTRLLLGLLAGHRFSATLTGDRSLRRRPMRRVTGPLGQMGARFVEHGGDGLPLTVNGGPLQPLRYAMPVSSAQIKGSLLLAGM
ncbi:MAG: 3-phosphoshikimate 1-carboxyvinyltransferase, partial [Gemmatimonadales bacterium]